MNKSLALAAFRPEESTVVDEIKNRDLHLVPVRDPHLRLTVLTSPDVSGWSLMDVRDDKTIALSAHKHSEPTTELNGHLTSLSAAFRYLSGSEGKRTRRELLREENLTLCLKRGILLRIEIVTDNTEVPDLFSEPKRRAIIAASLNDAHRRGLSLMRRHFVRWSVDPMVRNRPSRLNDVIGFIRDTPPIPSDPQLSAARFHVLQSILGTSILEMEDYGDECF